MGVVEALRVGAQGAIEPANHAPVNLRQPRSAFERTALTEMLSYAEGPCFVNLTVPERRPFAFAEFCLAGAAAQVADLVFTVDLAHDEILLTTLAK